MFGHESVRHADLIAGSYLWAGSPADVFVTQQSTQQVRRDKDRIQEYRRRITVEQLATAQVRLQDLDLGAKKHKEHALNLVGRGRGMIRRADKYLAYQHGREPEWVPGPIPTLLFSRIGQPRQMTINQHDSLLNLSTIPKGLTQRARKMTPKRMMMMTPLWVPTQHISRVVMIQTKPIEPIPLPRVRGATNRNARRVGAGVLPMLRGKRTGVRVKWSCLCSRTPLKRVH